ncbi:hypothetical protein C9374_012789 [Naegleria lovaniensis]|uniref:Dynein associated protein domain-containing protein n=1 Tax=Naegleria lovaniensis TaxID=51637 RepID=A0AA88G7R2_NAELO|nr:uncharacterized protein C9374_012789 [Naegleria lovaniensis]KAG2373187.1 hypothetical protein C9374_012789 [Naegleria lovaniensis]
MSASLHHSYGDESHSSDQQQQQQPSNTTFRRHSVQLEGEDKPLIMMTKSSEVSALSINERTQTAYPTEVRSAREHPKTLRSRKDSRSRNNFAYENSNLFSESSSHSTIPIKDLLDKLSIKEKKLEELHQKRLEREKKRFENTDIDTVLLEHKSRLDELQEEKNKMEQELTSIRNLYEDKITHLQLQVEELQLDKEIAEEHAKQLRDQLDEIIFKDGDMTKNTLNLDLEYLEVETLYKQKIQELLTKNADYATALNLMATQLSDLECYRHLYVDLERVNKEEIDLLRAELSERETYCHDLEQYLVKIQLTMNEKDSVELRANDQKQENVQLDSRWKNEERRIRSWQIEKEMMKIDIESLTKEKDILYSLLPEKFYEDHAVWMKIFFTIHSSSKKLEYAIQHFSELNYCSDLSSMDYHIRAHFFLSSCIYILEMYIFRIGSIECLKEISSNVKNFSEIQYAIDLLLHTLQKDTLTENSFIEITVSLSYSLTNLLRDAYETNSHFSGNISVILQPCLRVLDAIIEIIQYIKNLINNINFEPAKSNNPYTDIFDYMTECQYEFTIFAQNVRNLFTSTTKAYNALMRESNFNLLSQISQAHPHQSKISEKQLSKIEKILTSKIDVSYISSHQFSDISFRQLSQLVISVLGISHEDVVSLGKWFGQSKNEFLPLDSIRHFSHKIASSTNEIASTEQLETYDAMTNSVLSKKIVRFKKELEAFDVMKPLLERSDREKKEMTKLIIELQEKLQKLLEERDTMESLKNSIQNIENENKELQEKLTDMEHYKLKYEEAIHEEQLYMDTIDKMRNDIFTLDSICKELEERLQSLTPESGFSPKHPLQRQLSRTTSFSKRLPSMMGDQTDKFELEKVRHELAHLKHQNFITKVQQNENKLINIVHNPMFVEDETQQQKKQIRKALSNLMKEVTCVPLSVVDLTNSKLKPEKQLMKTLTVMEEQKRQLDTFNHTVRVHFKGRTEGAKLFEKK